MGLHNCRRQVAPGARNKIDLSGHPIRGQNPKTTNLSDAMYLSISLKKSTPPQKRELDNLISNSEHKVHDLMVELTF